MEQLGKVIFRAGEFAQSPAINDTSDIKRASLSFTYTCCIYS